MYFFMDLNKNISSMADYKRNELKMIQYYYFTLDFLEKNMRSQPKTILIPYNFLNIYILYLFIKSE